MHEHPARPGTPILSQYCRCERKGRLASQRLGQPALNVSSSEPQLPSEAVVTFYQQSLDLCPFIVAPKKSHSLQMRI